MLEYPKCGVVSIQPTFGDDGAVAEKAAIMHSIAEQGETIWSARCLAIDL